MTQKRSMILDNESSSINDWDTKEKLAWLAGFFDGEACIHFNKTKHVGWVGMVSVAQKEPTPLRRILEFAGEGLIPFPGIGASGSSSVVYFSWSKRASAELLQKLLPYFTQKNTARAEIFIKAFAQTNRPGQNLSTEETTRRFQLLVQFREVMEQYREQPPSEERAESLRELRAKLEGDGNAT